MREYINPQIEDYKNIICRVSENNLQIQERVTKILDWVKKDGDTAIKELSAQIDGVEIENLQVCEQEFAKAESLLPDNLKHSIKTAAENISKFHKAQQMEPVTVETFPGVKCIQKAVAIQKVGLYIPGGTAPLFSTVLMLAIPAKIAGCKEIILCTPTNKQGEVAPAVLYAAKLCGVTQFFKIGGAAAIGAMAYGTQSVPQVHKIFGPGNRYVTKAKEIVSNCVAIDMPAGPSEVMVIADNSANAEFVASDLLSQAEHGADSQVILICNCKDFAERVKCAVAKQLETLERKELAQKALQESSIVILEKTEDQIELANTYAPEHLIISTQNPWEIADKITAAGSIFIGNYTPESAGDYASGTNHTLPTAGWAKSFSGVNIDSFTRKITYQQITKEGLEKLGPIIIEMAQAEGLQAHANAVKIRINN